MPHQLQNDEHDDPDGDVDVEDPSATRYVQQRVPPSSGPTTVEIPKTAPIKPGWRPRSRGETTSPITACVDTINAAAAQTLHTAKHDQLGHVLAQPAQDRTHQEHDERDLQHELAPVHVSELPRDRCRNPRTPQIRRHHPWQTREKPQRSPAIVGNAVETIVEIERRHRASRASRPRKRDQHEPVGPPWPPQRLQR